MHVQDAVPGWLDAVRLLPSGGLVKSVSNPSLLREAKSVNPNIITDYRHYIPNQEFSSNYDVAKGIARSYFRRFIDRTYLEQYVQWVDLVEELNEYYDQGMTEHDPETLQARYVTATAHANVWNDEYRGRTVTSSDGGQGFIPSRVKLVIGNSPVGNNIPKRFAELAIATDNLLGYHPYTRASVRIWPNTIRDPGDWRFHSGRWSFMEQEWGLRPRWCFTEMMPYMGSAEGWRNWVVLDGDEDLLIQLHRQWLNNISTTDAYKTGRIIGSGAWFTIGGGLSWKDYSLERNQLIRLAEVTKEHWHPGQETPMPDNQTVIRAVLTKLEEAKTLLLPLAAPKHTLANLTNNQVFTLFKKAFGDTYFSKVVIACDEAYMLAHRLELYKGFPIEDMPGLTQAEKDKLITAIPLVG